MFLFLCPQPFDEIREFFLMIVGRNSQFFMHSFDEIWDDFSPLLNVENCHLFPWPLIKCKIFSMVVWGDLRFFPRWIADTRNSSPPLKEKKIDENNISAIFHATHCKFRIFFFSFFPGEFKIYFMEFKIFFFCFPAFATDTHKHLSFINIDNHSFLK